MNAVVKRDAIAYYDGMKLAAKLRMLIDRNRTSQRELARIAGVSYTTVNNACKGKDMWLCTAIQIARALGVSLDYLADDAQDEPPRPSLSNEEASILRLARVIGLVEAERRLMLAPPESGQSLRPLAVKTLRGEVTDGDGGSGGVANGNNPGVSSKIAGRGKPDG